MKGNGVRQESGKRHLNFNVLDYKDGKNFNNLEVE
jgi:hypothetical protein